MFLQKEKRYHGPSRCGCIHVRHVLLSSASCGIVAGCEAVFTTGTA
jgi:hypothetical protein